MNLTILSRGARIPSTRRLTEAARARGHRVRVVDPLDVQLHLGAGAPGLYHREKKLPKTDLVIPRIAQSINTYGLAVVNQFEITGVKVLNRAMAIAQSRNKMRVMQLLAREQIPVPPTLIGRGALELRRMAAQVGGPPVAVKLTQGNDRYGVVVCESEQSLEAVLEAILSMGHNTIVQQYVAPGKGRDLRALVVGGEVIASVRRHARTGRLSTSLGAGVSVTRVRLSAAQQELALRAAAVVGLEVCAVDMLELDEGTTVFEVISSPGLKALETAMDRDLATPIIRHIEVLFSR